MKYNTLSSPTEPSSFMLPHHKSSKLFAQLTYNSYKKDNNLFTHTTSFQQQILSWTSLLSPQWHPIILCMFLLHLHPFNSQSSSHHRTRINPNSLTAWNSQYSPQLQTSPLLSS
jgi:hypothetical protein